MVGRPNRRIVLVAHVQVVVEDHADQIGHIIRELLRLWAIVHVFPGLAEGEQARHRRRIARQRRIGSGFARQKFDHRKLPRHCLNVSEGHSLAIRSGRGFRSRVSQPIAKVNGFPPPRSPRPSAHTTHTPARQSPDPWPPPSACRCSTVLTCGRPLGRELLVQIQHALDQGDHPVVPRDVGGGGEVDGADGGETEVMSAASENRACPSPHRRRVHR